MILFIFGLVCAFSAVGSVELLSADPSILDLIRVIATFGLGVIMMLLGIDKIKCAA